MLEGSQSPLLGIGYHKRISGFVIIVTPVTSSKLLAPSYTNQLAPISNRKLSGHIVNEILQLTIFASSKIVSALYRSQLLE